MPRRAPHGWPLLVGGAITAAVVLIAWLPVGALLSQRAAIAATAARLEQLQAQGRQVDATLAWLDTPEAKLDLGREDYQLVLPGQRLLQVLPTSSVRGAADDAPYATDPGLSAIVDPVTGALVALHPRAARPGPPGYLSRVLSTLEFWR